MGFTLLAPASDSYANHLAGPTPELLQLKPAYRTLVILTLLCLVPRAAMVPRIPSICPDGVLYVRFAEAIEQGDFLKNTQDVSLNTYPFILAGLHHLGFSWEWAAAVWGVAMSTLVVLPLWAWVRRQFDDRVATVACLLYIVNPKMIEWSPEAMRDQTFWLFFMLAIYWLWRAMTEVRYVWFVAGGAAFTLAALTRFEGLFLLAPIACWTFCRYRALKTDRKKLLVGAAMSVALFPLLLAAASLAFAGGHANLISAHMTRIARVVPWFQSLFHHAAGAAAAGIEKPMSPGTMVWVFIPTMTRGLSPVFALLLFGGLWGWRREWSRRDHQPLFFATLIVLAGIWVQLWYDRTMCPRYALPIVLMGAPFAALGLLGFIARVRRAASWICAPSKVQNAMVGAVAVVIVALSMADTIVGNEKYFETRQMAVDLGRWTKAQSVVSPVLLGPIGITPIVSFYADGVPYYAFRWETTDAAIVSLSDCQRADIVLLQSAKDLTNQRCDAIANQLEQNGFRLLNAGELPTTCRGIRVLVRSDAIKHVANSPTQTF
jgi:hypothetical protein